MQTRRPVRRILKLLAALLGEEEGRFVCMPSSTTLKILTKLGISDIEQSLQELVREGSVKIQRVGKGYRICVHKDDEYVKLRDFIFVDSSLNITFEEFEKLFDNTIMKLRQRSVSGFVDLGQVKDMLMREYGIPEDLFVNYVTKLLTVKRWKYIVNHGGSFRVKIGNVHVGLVKLVRQ